MKKKLTLSLILGIGFLGCQSLMGKTVKADSWVADVNAITGKVSIFHKGLPLVKESLAEWVVRGDTLDFSQCEHISISESSVNDKFGRGKKITLAGRRGGDNVAQYIYIYPDKDFFTTELELSSKDNIESNYIAPVAVSKPYSLFDRTGNDVIFIPYDNDAWVRYSITPFGKVAPVSYEVSAVINEDTREGLIIGSVEHDLWKTGVKISNDGLCSLDTLKAFGGVATNLTRDIIPHGAVKGKKVKSPLIFVGRFADWRDGMEGFADACAVIAPKIEGGEKRPFGWNSWGKLQTKINYDKASEVSEFFSRELQPNSFENDGVVYIGLDAFWDFGFKPEQHKEFVESCRQRGQKAGIYYCPFTDWGKNPEAAIAEMPEYKFKDVYLYGDGKILEFDGAYALDPTHPAVKARIKRQLEELKDWGYEYVKIDFMAHGGYEADSHFDKNVTTGVQAYNQGMEYIDEVVDGKMWINLSIAPLFPANYAHSRRIGCDAWADINNTEYTLNALTYGWWLDHVYHFNDADHIVLEGVSDGENRARVTSSAITGVYLLGDDMSNGGDDAVKRRIIRNLTNPDINAMARECKSFRPVEVGHGDRAADAFYYSCPECIYVAVFNFDSGAARKRIPLRRLGLSEGADYQAEELWSHDKMNLSGNIDVEIPGKDVKVFRINIETGV